VIDSGDSTVYFRSVPSGRWQFRPGRTAGRGLGLAIVHELMELPAGTVTATSGAHGLGARFTVRLPTFDGASETGQLDAAS
jgi:signal transduction histidine kinase